MQLIKKLMFNRKRAAHLIIDGLPAHKKAVVKDYVASTQGELILHSCPISHQTSQSRISWYGVGKAHRRRAMASSKGRKVGSENSGAVFKNWPQSVPRALIF